MLEKTKDAGLDRRTLPPFGEFVVLIAVMFGLTAFSIDNLLPAFVPIGDSFRISDPNQLQLLITSYMIGFGVMQLVYGPVSDSIGRRPMLMTGIAVYIAGCLAALAAPTYEWLLAARLLQGLGAAAMRVLCIAVVRDCYEGRDMARVMSLSMMVFLVIPTVAPAIGSLILTLGDWHLIFVAMLVLAVIVVTWFGLRLPETLHPAYRVALSPQAISGAVRMTLTNRMGMGYSTGVGLMMGCILTYVSTAQQVFETQVYALGPWFPFAFGVVAIVMAAASFLNSLLVRRIGMRTLSHGGMFVFTAMAALMLAFSLAFGGRPPLALFLLPLCGMLFVFSIVTPNFNSMAMEPLGAIAGTASSVTGFYSTLLGVALSFMIGQAFDGTLTPIAAGFLVLAVLTILVTLWTERGRLFRPHHHGA